MHTLIHPYNSFRRAPASHLPGAFRQPHFECEEMTHALKLTIYAPGVEASGVEIRYRGSDLVVTARKSHVVRVNFNALHLEGVQRDYQLRLRLGTGIDLDALEAEFASGLLTLTLPKAETVSPGLHREAAAVA